VDKQKNGTKSGVWPIPQGALITVAYDKGGAAAVEVSGDFAEWGGDYLILTVTGKAYWIPHNRIYHIKSQ